MTRSAFSRSPAFALGSSLLICLVVGMCGGLLGWLVGFYSIEIHRFGGSAYVHVEDRFGIFRLDSTSWIDNPDAFAATWLPQSRQVGALAGSILGGWLASIAIARLQGVKVSRRALRNSAITGALAALTIASAIIAWGVWLMDDGLLDSVRNFNQLFFLACLIVMVGTLLAATLANIYTIGGCISTGTSNGTAL